MKKILRYLFSCILFVTSIGVYCTNRLMYMKKKEDSFIYNRELQAGHINPNTYETIAKQEVKILSPYGYYLTAILVEQWQNNRYIIISHGVTENKTNSIKYMNLFLEREFNVIMYDHRRHGQSGGKTTSFGYYEKNDLKAVVDWVRKEKGENILLGIHGESMGAATMMQACLKMAPTFILPIVPFLIFQKRLVILFLLKLSCRQKPFCRLPISF